MSPEDQERLRWLCQRIQEEKDHDKFTALVIELNDLLQRNETHFAADATKPKPAAGSGSSAPRERHN